MNDISISESYLWCKQVCKESKSSFVPAFGLVDADRRNAMYALYAFARISDDLADGEYSRVSHEEGVTKHENRDHEEQKKEALEHETRNAGKKVKEEALAAWRQRLEQALSPALSSQAATDLEAQTSLDEFDSLWPGLADCSRKYSIPSQHLLEIIDGVAMDIEPSQPATMQDLKDYCYLVASAVGLACTYIWKNESEQIDAQAAVDCGIAFQLTNILRDVHEDAQQGRIYLPKELFDKHAVDEQSWLALAPTGNWQEMMREVASEAHRLYLTGWKTIRSLESNSQRMFSLMWRAYHHLLQVVERDLEKSWNRKRKARLRFQDKLVLFGSHYLRPLYRTLPAPEVSRAEVSNAAVSKAGPQ